MTHGYPVERAVVLFHAYTSAPQQFRAWGQRLFTQGDNVYVPRAPHHGLPDPLTTEHAQLTATELQQAAAQALQIARGLGSRVSVIGLSMGGLMAGWLAQQAAEIDCALLIAPALSLRGLPWRVTPLVREAALRLPNAFRWLNRAAPGAGAGPRHAYLRYSTRSLAQILRLSRDLQAAAARSAPAARAVIVVTNANDEMVDNTSTARLVAAWRRAGARNVSTYEFGAADRLAHDLIDPDQPNQRADYVYEVLTKLLDNA
jgi:carboxylesterase